VESVPGAPWVGSCVDPSVGPDSLKKKKKKKKKKGKKEEEEEITYLCRKSNFCLSKSKPVL
jgi:hypothetical protein